MYAVDFQVDLGAADAGLVLTATVKTMAGAAVASGLGTIVEDPAGSGVYWWAYASFADDTSYRVFFYNGATFKVAVGVSPSDAAIPVDSASIAAILAKTNTIGAATITAVSPVAATGDVSIVRGSDYAAADGRVLEWMNTDGDWPDLTDATITYTARLYDLVLSVEGEVLVPTGPGQQVRVELTAEDTDLALGAWSFEVQAVLDGNEHVIPLVLGTQTVLANVPVPEVVP